MTRDEVKEIFKVVKNVYSQFEVNSDKLDLWSRMLNDQDYKRVMRNTERYVLENKFPPTIADLRERRSEAYSSDFLQKVRGWEANASAGKPRS